MNFFEKIIDYDYLWFLSYISSLLTFEIIIKIVVIYFFIVWIAIVIWVTKDIINRTNNILYQIFWILTVLVWTPLWIVVYLLIRPSKTLFEKYYEEAQIDEDNLEDIDLNEKKETHKCPKCDYVIKEEYKFCPNCRQELKKNCISCNMELKPEWTICPYCGKDQESKIENILSKKEDLKKQKEKNKEEKKDNS